MRAISTISALLLTTAATAGPPAADHAATPAELLGQALDRQARARAEGDGLILIPFETPRGSATLAINTHAPGWAAAASGGPVLPLLTDIGAINIGGGTFSGDPTSQVEVTNVFGILDAVPFGLFIEGFDVVTRPVRSSFDYGLGDIDDNGPLFAPYFAEFPDVNAAVAWFTTGLSGMEPSLSGSTVTTNAMPRELFPFTTTGDTETFTTTVIGSPDIGDGVIGWHFAGVTRRDGDGSLVDDAQEILADPSLDLNGNGILDVCDSQAINLDVSDFFSWGPVDPLLGAAAGQRGAWQTTFGLAPEGYATPLRNTAGVLSGVGLTPNFNGNTLAADSGWFGTVPSGLTPLLEDGWSVPSAPTDLTITGLTPGGYRLYVYAWGPIASSSSTFVTVPGHPTQLVEHDAWPGDFTVGITHAEFDVSTVDGTLLITLTDNGLFNGIWPFFNGLQIVPLDDCNLNGTPDIDEITQGLVADLDGNGVPDECEADLAIRQLTWVMPDGVVSQPFTNIGQITLSALEPPHGRTSYFNAVIDGDWVVRNGIITPIDGDHAVQDYSFKFLLDTTPGTAVTSVDCVFDLTTGPLLLAPAEAFATPLPVTEHLFRPGLEFDPLDVPGPIVPGPGENFVGTITGTPEPVVRRGVPHVSELVNHCVPGGVSRCLSWLNDIYCLGFTGACADPQQLMNLLATSPYFDTSQATGTQVPKQMGGTQQFFDDKGLDSKLSVMQINPVNGDTPTPDDVMDGLKQGKDVMFVVIWLKADGTPNGAHFMTVVAGVEGATASDHQFVLQDDGMGANNQGDGAADVGATNFKFKQRGDGKWEMTGHGGGTNYLKRIVLICPRPLAQLEAISKAMEIEIASVLFDAQQSGTLPTQQELDDLAKKACDAADVAGFLLEHLEDSPLQNDPVTITRATQLRDAAALLKDEIMTLQDIPTLANIDAALATIDLDAAPRICQLRDTRLDCNGNFVDDSWEIEQGLLTDANGDGIADECGGLPPTCPTVPEDVNGDGQVDVQDLLQVLGDWGPCPAPCASDINGDGSVDVAELLDVLAAWD